MRPVAIAPTLAPRMPMYPPGAPGLGQQLFYGQAPPAIIPPQVQTVWLTFICLSLFLSFSACFPHRSFYEHILFTG